MPAGAVHNAGFSALGWQLTTVDYVATVLHRIVATIQICAVQHELSASDACRPWLPPPPPLSAAELSQPATPRARRECLPAPSLPIAAASRAHRWTHRMRLMPAARRLRSRVRRRRLPAQASWLPPSTVSALLSPRPQVRPPSRWSCPTASTLASTPRQLASPCVHHALIPMCAALRPALPPHLVARAAIATRSCLSA